MLGNMIGGMPYQSNRDGLFGDQMANSLGSAINRPQEMMAQPMQQAASGGASNSMLFGLLPGLLMQSMGKGGNNSALAGGLGGLLPGLLAGGDKKQAPGAGGSDPMAWLSGLFR